MVSGKYSALACAISREQAIANLSNNLANVNTNGFKRDRALFEDLLYHNVRQAGGHLQGRQLQRAERAGVAEGGQHRRHDGGRTFCTASRTVAR